MVKKTSDNKTIIRCVVAVVVLAAILTITAFAVKAGKARADVHETFDQTPMLYTMECVAQTIVAHKGAEALKWVGDRDLIVPVKASIKVGYRLSDISDVNIEGQRVTLTLPAPVVEIQNPEVVYDEAITKVGFFRRKFSQEELSAITAEGVQQLEERLDSYQLIEPAQQQAQLIIAGMLRAKGYEVVFRAAPTEGIVEGALKRLKTRE
ncbi:MAG: DUF4230 domain-containing protein [Prevotella sp.]|nr:DUF4230 domain-containing protein [Prevotella sp.]